MTEVFAASKKTAAAIRGRNESRVSQIRPVPLQVLDIIIHFLHTVKNGYLILTIQDGHVVKIEKTEKFIISAKTREAGCISYDKPQKKHPLQGKITAELQAIQYGQLVIRLDNGQVEQIEKTEKRRVHELEGIHGDGI
ncbi:DUF2292 domain-containing protein|uniref:Uncharacterized small protein n=1 Tax=Dendrosporobacter quercicolus TaxID=146817 RepID=A0A1G9RYZ3_9FIRM|nr:DUF2292 domain-containing protein [Dendrosporobacter quercicolus]NSL49526.1 DUF2292 domain-containing protein [Dendrosporobacter quercicolus DSM 1736]SDM28230.1 Uncharacterized small protein [Dendrosporobacter quercicolus]